MGEIDMAPLSVSISGRLGDPDQMMAQQCLITLRPLMRAAFADIASDIASIDFVVWVNGSISTYFPSGGVARVRFSVAARALAVDLCVDDSDIASLGDGTASSWLGLLRERFVDSVEPIVDRAQQRKFHLYARELADAISQAFDAAARGVTNND
jgi:hypothetical protein